MLPEKFMDRMKGLLGEEYDEFIKAFGDDENRYHALRINRLKAMDTAGEVALKFSRGGETIKVPWEESGFYYEEESSPGKHPYHEAGVYYIQEPSAMAPVSFLDPRPGERVLDLCAAPGGKTTQIADRMKGEGILVTNEINRDRARILSLNVERLGIGNALVLNEDSGHLAEVFEGYFDRILVDAPCSGEGMFRKNEKAFAEWSGENVEMCAKRQEEILDNAARMLSPGGRIVYSTCTFAPLENETQIYRFLLKHSDFHTCNPELVGGMERGRTGFIDLAACERDLPFEPSSSDKQRAYEEVENSVRLWPHRVKGEGHFLCVLERDGVNMLQSTGYAPGGGISAAKKEQVRPFLDFEKESLCVTFGSDRESDFRGSFLMFGDQLYFCPPYMPSIKGLKVLRPGLHLGTNKKDRFEPSHALGLFLGKRNVRISCELSSESPTVKQYLNGQSLRPGEEQNDLKDKKGWCLMTCDGYSIGWSKLSGGVLKNHYPKGLRINY
ncbi:MAG: RsmF rRNA methyltransferase first C-terminal domain-containing protein [Butyrivibrio sp.]|nr:RsmF rRNA methyltransferase first C-terminal domain-containing protein [Butyrivibrio sp.]